MAEKPAARGHRAGSLGRAPYNVPVLHKKRRLSSDTGLIFAGSVLFSIGYVGPTLVRSSLRPEKTIKNKTRPLSVCAKRWKSKKTPDPFVSFTLIDPTVPCAVLHWLVLVFGIRHVPVYVVALQLLDPPTDASAKSADTQCRVERTSPSSIRSRAGPCVRTSVS